MDITMTDDAIGAAAAILWRQWQQFTRIPELPPDYRPTSRADGYAIQAALVDLSGQRSVGWKIAATSLAGQKHIGVDGPLAGRLMANRVLDAGARVSLDGNLMMVGEAEFAFRMKRTLPAREGPYAIVDVLDAVASMHPTIEIPDSRYDNFAAVGAPQLIADDASASWLIVGAAAPESWRTLDLSAHQVTAYLDDDVAAEGIGANVLGDPRVALTWLVNELGAHGIALGEGELVTTGTCILPVPLARGRTLGADFGVLGALQTTLV